MSFHNGIYFLVNTTKKEAYMFDCKYYEIKLESVGGMGANLLGEMLGQLGANYLGLQSQSFSSYGSEKRGSPVKSYIRWSKGVININSPITNPNILGIFYDHLLTKKGSLNGITEQTTIVINSDLEVDKIAEYLKVKRIYAIDCEKIALETKSRINVIMLGAIIKAIGFIKLEDVEKLVKETVGKKYPKLLDSNLAGVRRGYEEVKFGEFEVEELKFNYHTTQKWGYVNAPIGGVNPQRGGTIVNDLSASRSGYIPLFIPERCINCALCDITCPDMVFQFKEGEYKNKRWMINLGPDYHHCKGCMRCVEICPTEALVAGVEKEHRGHLKSIRNLMLIEDNLEYEAQGASSWVTSESYTNVERVDGGIK
jgi:pyruvate ferredoxin oxidoreductase gamma subunit